MLRLTKKRQKCYFYFKNTSILSKSTTKCSLVLFLNFSKKKSFFLLFLFEINLNEEKKKLTTKQFTAFYSFFSLEKENKDFLSFFFTLFWENEHFFFFFSTKFRHHQNSTSPVFFPKEQNSCPQLALGKAMHKQWFLVKFNSQTQKTVLILTKQLLYNFKNKALWKSSKNALLQKIILNCFFFLCQSEPKTFCWRQVFRHRL